MARPADLLSDNPGYRQAVTAAARGDAPAQRQLTRCYLDAALQRPDNAEPLSVHAVQWARLADANTGTVEDKGLLIMALGLAVQTKERAGEAFAAHWLAAEGLAVANDAVDAAVGTAFDGWAVTILQNLVEACPVNLVASAQFIREGQ